MVMRRWKKVGRLRERRRRPKASRIPPGTVPKYRTELARPHCRIRLHASVSDRPFSEPLGKRIFGGRSARLRVLRKFCDFDGRPTDRWYQRIIFVSLSRFGEPFSRACYEVDLHLLNITPLSLSTCLVCM